MKSSQKILPYLLGVVLCQAAGIFGSFFTIAEIPTWYAALNQPTWQPPNWLFGPVWTFLYICMGIAGARIWMKTKRGDVLRRIFIGQLLLNALWTPVFFSAHNIVGAVVMIIALDVAVAVLVWNLRSRDRTASVLLFPYLVWILFATALNTAILILNP